MTSYMYTSLRILFIIYTRYMIYMIHLTSFWDLLVLGAGYVLCDAPELLKNAQANPAIGLVEALKALVRVQDMMQALTS